MFGNSDSPWSHGAVALHKDGKSFYRIPARTRGITLRDRLMEAYQRYGMPVMVTETSARDGVAGRARWMDETIAVVHELRAAGVPLVGYTWFPLLLSKITFLAKMQRKTPYYRLKCRGHPWQWVQAAK